MTSAIPSRRTILMASLMLAGAQFACAGPALSQQAVVRGTVFEPNGRPASGVWIVLSSQGRTWRFLSGADGGFFIGGLTSGRYRLTVTRNNAEVFATDISVPTKEPLAIRLR
jgi:Carboxypeptidase regulatory-like domain